MTKKAKIMTMAQSAKKISQLSKKLFLQGFNDYVLICNGFFVARVDRFSYETEFRCASPDYIDVPDGARAMRDGKEAMRLNERGVNIAQIIAEHKKENTAPITDTRFIDLRLNARVFLTDAGDIVTVNADYLKALEPFTTSTFYGSKMTAPIISDTLYSDDEATPAALILPIRNALAGADVTITRKGATPDSVELAGDELIKEAQEAAADVLKHAEAQAAKLKEEAAALVKEARAEAVATMEAARDERKKILQGARDKSPQEAEKEAAPQEAPQEVKRARIVRNEAAHGIEIYFEEVPRAALRNVLKSNGFRWHATKKCWYAKRSEKAEAVALSIAK